MDSYLLFHSNNHVIWAAKQLKILNISHKMVSVPRELSSNCGYCLSIAKEDAKKILSILEEQQIEYDRLILPGDYGW